MDMDMNMDDTLFPVTEYMVVPQQGSIQENGVWMYNSSYPDYSAQQPGSQLAHAPVYQQSLQYPRHSISTQASFASSSRSSRASALSQWQPRSSLASTASSWSNNSEQLYNQRGSSISISTSLEPTVSSSYTVSCAEESASPIPSTRKRKKTQRQVTPDKDPFATCISRTRRSRRSQREPNYWCTSCQEPFVEKYDWKRHEETYQERRFAFRCSLCSAIYFLEKDFLYHHETRHNCETCHREGHLESAKQIRISRSGWGCGFCTHFSVDWKERCNHVAQHFENGLSMADWHQSNVIHSLLHRPAIYGEWCRILQTQPQLRRDFGWNEHDTGRVEGYPENDAEPHLQDLLEYYRSGDNPAALAQLAFHQIAFPSRPPQAPRKDYKDHHTATLEGLMADTESWNKFMSTIPEDDFLPTNVCEFDFDMIDETIGENTKIYR